MWTYRIKYLKLGPIRFISHLDVMRAITRAVNRARIPVAYSEGFNPRPRLSMGPALPLGYESKCELADITLARMISPQALHERLEGAMPRGLDLLETDRVSSSSPRLSDAFSARYVIQLPGGETTDKIETLIDAFLKKESVLVERVRQEKRSIVDVRRIVTDVSVKDEAGARWLQADISMSPLGSCNASEVAQAVLQISSDRAKTLRIIRTGIRFRNPAPKGENR